MENFSSKVLETIKQKAIKPIPKWYFSARNFILWFLAILATFLGGLAFSLVMLFMNFQQVGMNFPRPQGKLHWLIVSIPYAWLVVFVLLVGVIYFNLKHFKNSYKYPAYLLIIASLCGSIVIGFITVGLDGHRRMNEEFSRHLPFYGPVFDARTRSWGRPDDGALAGKVKALESDNFILEDLRGHEWKIIFDTDNSQEGATEITVGQMVMINGQSTEKGVFLAEEISPWEGCRGRCHLIGPAMPKLQIEFQQ